MPESVQKPQTINLDFQFAGFQNLMPHRVNNILLVCSLYESFILEEDGLVSELITHEYLDLQLSHSPNVSQVATADDALRFVRTQPVDLVITMTRLGRWNVQDFARQVKNIRPDLPVVVLLGESRELARHPNLREAGGVDRVFVWNGDAKILLAIIKFVEDQLNVEHDTRVGDVRVILLVENSVRFTSRFLPLIYTELMNLTKSLMREGINPTLRLLRMRARPKVLLAETFEEAWALYTRFHANVLGLISDVRFPRGGERDPDAGLELTRRVRDDSPYLPVLLQSSDPDFAPRAEELKAAFVNKNSSTLLQDLRSFLRGSLGFGDFVFKLPDGTEVGRAEDLRSLEEVLPSIPDESIAFHARHNHFSNWLMARTEFEIAALIGPRRASDFPDTAAIRNYLLATLAEFRERSQSGVIAYFSPDRFDHATTFARIGGGSLGGKARGLAFVNALLRYHNLHHRFDSVQIAVPNSAAIGTEVFDAFLAENDLLAAVAAAPSDLAIAQAFVAAPFPATVLWDLAAFLKHVRYPLAVRSSSLLEDAQDRPFAGVYATYMLPNNHPDPSVRLDQLCTAVKLVYASTFFRAARQYLDSTGHRPEEEKMGVILQQLVGQPYGDRFYPTFSGVARSYNFYPAGQMRPEDGIACVALGLGKTVVEGRKYLMFCPAHPAILPQFPTTDDLLTHSQRTFYALRLDGLQPDAASNPDANVVELGLDAAEQDGTLAPIGSVYSPQNDAVYDGIQRPGVRVVTFAHILKSDLFPLANILRELLDIGRDGLASPVEIEFAVNLDARPRHFAFLQIRPIAADFEFANVQVDNLPRSHMLCFSSQALGNGRICGIRDIVYVKPDAFDSASTLAIAAEIAQFNDRLRANNHNCILIGPGRWGTADHWLGIPVAWDQINSAQLIVETSLNNFAVAPSQGTHFFQNLTSLQVGYLTVTPEAADGFIDWAWLSQQPTASESRFVRHVRLPQPVVIRLDGRSRQGAVLKPGIDDDVLASA